MARKQKLSRNLNAFLDMIRWSELGDAIIKGSDEGYNVIVGSTPTNINTFSSYKDHPNITVDIPKFKIKSTAAGAYQILARFAKFYMRELGLPDFSPASQDAIAIQLIKECNALADIEAGRIEKAIEKCASRWASFPKAGYGQHERTFDDLIAHYIAYGGQVA